MLTLSTAVFAGGAAEKDGAQPQKYALMMSHMTNAFTMELSNRNNFV